MMNRRDFLRSAGAVIAATVLLPKNWLLGLGEKVGIGRGSSRIIDNPGTVWFLSDNGDDDNDGLTPETPKKTITNIPFNTPETNEFYFLLSE